MDPPTTVPPANSSNSLQLRAATFAFPDTSCNIQMQENGFGDIQQLFGDRMLPSGGYSAASGMENGGSGYSASLSPASSLPLPWCHGLSSDADYYGPGMVGSSEARS